MERNFWKKKRKHKHSRGTCGNPQCTICHANKVLDIPDRRTMRENSKVKTNNYDRY